MKKMKTQVGIIGAGPAGLLLGQMLFNRGIESIILEAKGREYVRSRLRAGIQEQTTVDTFVSEGVGEKLKKEGLIHKGKYLHFDHRKYYLDAKKFTGKVVTAYGQRNITCDMIDIREKNKLPIFFEAPALKVDEFENGKTSVYFKHDNEEKVMECDFVAGCDGFFGISRKQIPKNRQNLFEKKFPYSWFGVLAEAPPAQSEVIYAHSKRGFALQSMRGRKMSRLYIQVPPDENIDRWDEHSFFNEFEQRIGVGYQVNRGKIIDKTLAHMRSYVMEPMQYGNLFLAGDAAHIVPPTGAKGMNLAVADVRVLGAALNQYYRYKNRDLLNLYSEICLARVWKVERFSWWFTLTTHLAPNQDDFDTKMQESTLRYIVESEAGQHSLVENYVGLPYDERINGL